MGCADAGAGAGGGGGGGGGLLPGPLAPAPFPIARWDAPEVRSALGSVEVALGDVRWVIPICRRLLQVWEGGITALHTLLSVEQV